MVLVTVNGTAGVVRDIVLDGLDNRRLICGDVAPYNL